jgi:hypothetical protein
MSKTKFKVNDIELPLEPWLSTSGKEPTIYLEVDLNAVVDGYSYHDFPPEETIYFNLEEATQLRDHLTLLIEKMKLLEESHVREN